MQSLIALIEEAIRQYADRPAFACMGNEMSFLEFGRQTQRLGDWLIAQRLPPGSKVAVMLPNIFQNPVAVAAILRAGMVVVNVNPLYTPRELALQLNDSKSAVLIALENFAHTIDKADKEFGLPKLQTVVLTELGDAMGAKGRLINLVVRYIKRMIPDWKFPARWRLSRWPTILAAKRRVPADTEIAPVPPRLPWDPLLDVNGHPIHREKNDLALLQYTGGTTGVAKGAMLTHGNLLANLEQCESWLSPSVLAAELKAQYSSFRNLTMVCALPLYHIFSFTACMMLGFKVGFKNLLVPNPRDLKSVIHTLSLDPPHLFPGVNTLFNALLNHPEFRRMDFSQLKIAVGGGMSVTASVAQRWQEKTGVVMLEGYGLSETSPVVAATPRTLKEFTGSVGLPMPGTEIQLLDEQGEAIANPSPDQRGEIAVRGPQVMLGYWNSDEDRNQVFTDDGFFRTGDIGAIDAQGYLHVVDRKKDMILVSGFNVYPSEIEQVVSGFPGVSECAALGVSDPVTGEAVKLFVVPTSAGIDRRGLQAYCASHLTNYKRPRDIEVRDVLPKSAVGKVLRRALRDNDQQG
jgi:long-chain acyl-CoA synthetase